MYVVTLKVAKDHRTLTSGPKFASMANFGDVRLNNKSKNGGGGGRGGGGGGSSSDSSAAAAGGGGSRTNHHNPRRQMMTNFQAAKTIMANNPLQIAIIALHNIYSRIIFLSYLVSSLS